MSVSGKDAILTVLLRERTITTARLIEVAGFEGTRRIRELKSAGLIDYDEKPDPGGHGAIYTYVEKRGGVQDRVGWPTHCGWCKAKAVAVLQVEDWDDRLAGACEKHRKMMQPKVGVKLYASASGRFYGETVTGISGRPDLEER